MDYAARLCFVFQESIPTAQVAILGPTLDVWSQKGLDRNLWITTPWYLHALWQALNHHGYLADYINTTILQRADFTDGDIRYGPMQYNVLMVTNVETLEPNTARAILQYAENGGKVIFIGKIPYRSPTLLQGCREYEIFDQLRPGKNVLKIKVATLLFNYCHSLKDNPVCQYWISRSKTHKSLPSGLLGPVRLFKMR